MLGEREGKTEDEDLYAWERDLEKRERNKHLFLIIWVFWFLNNVPPKQEIMCKLYAINFYLT